MLSDEEELERATTGDESGDDESGGGASNPKFLILNTSLVTRRLALVI
jgi:hypothetical protein